MIDRLDIASVFELEWFISVADNVSILDFLVFHFIVVMLHIDLAVRILSGYLERNERFQVVLVIRCLSFGLMLIIIIMVAILYFWLYHGGGRILIFIFIINH